MERVNRFTATVRVDGKQYYALLRNTGRILELEKGTEVFCLPKAKERTSFILVGCMVNGQKNILDTRIQCAAFERALEMKLLPWLSGWAVIKREVGVDGSRIDYGIGRNSEVGYLETKSAAQLVTGHASYPDCPTDRGVKHIRLLGSLAKGGLRSIVLFICTHPGAGVFSPNWNADPRVGDALLRARSEGAEVRCIKIVLEDEYVSLATADLPVLLERRF